MARIGDRVVAWAPNGRQADVAARAKSRRIRIESHEIRTPLVSSRRLRSPSHRLARRARRRRSGRRIGRGRRSVPAVGGIAHHRSRTDRGPHRSVEPEGAIAVALVGDDPDRRRPGARRIRPVALSSRSGCARTAGSVTRARFVSMLRRRTSTRSSSWSTSGVAEGRGPEGRASSHGRQWSSPAGPGDCVVTGATHSTASGAGASGRWRWVWWRWCCSPAARARPSGPWRGAPSHTGPTTAATPSRRSVPIRTSTCRWRPQHLLRHRLRCRRRRRSSRMRYSATPPTGRCLSRRGSTSRTSPPWRTSAWTPTRTGR